MLHSNIEDTATNFGELENKFGGEIAKAVSALSKNQDLPKDQQVQDCFNKIRLLQTEVWVVKLADRITNLQKPPARWSLKKKKAYYAEAKVILEELGKGNEYLAKRFEIKIQGTRHK